MDPDDGQTPLLIYSIARTWPPLAADFLDVIDQGASGGRLFISASGANYKFDFETLPSFSVLLNVTDPAGLWGTGNITITLQDVNEQPSLVNNGACSNSNRLFASQARSALLALHCSILFAFPGIFFSCQLSLSAATRWVFENATANTIVGPRLGVTAGAAIPATDPENSVLAYTIVGGDPDGLFDIGALDGILRVRSSNSLNYEAVGGQTYTLQVRVEDTGQPGNGAKLRDTAPVVINIGDSNDPPTIISQTLAVDENSAYGTIIGIIDAGDEDAGDTGTFRIVRQDLTLSNEAPFTIVPSTGELRVAAVNGTASPALNFELKSSYQLTVSVTDRGGLVASAVMTVNLRDMPDAPRFTRRWFDFSVAKNARTGLVFGSVAATDEDAGDSIIFSIDPVASNGTALFSVDANNGGVTVARVGTSFLPMTDPFVLYVVATDATGLSDRAMLRVQVIESNGELA